jgi:hypothetical protein
MNNVSQCSGYNLLKRSIKNSFFDIECSDISLPYLAKNINPESMKNSSTIVHPHSFRKDNIIPLNGKTAGSKKL